MRDGRNLDRWNIEQRCIKDQSFIIHDHLLWNGDARTLCVARKTRPRFFLGSTSCTRCMFTIYSTNKVRVSLATMFAKRIDFCRFSTREKQILSDEKWEITLIFYRLLKFKNWCLRLKELLNIKMLWYSYIFYKYCRNILKLLETPEIGECEIIYKIIK